MKKYIFSLMIAVAAATGCKDFLTEAPVLSQSDELTMSDFKGLDKATAGAYAPLAANSWYGGNFILMNELKTANGKKYIGSTFDTGRLTDYYNMNYSEDRTSGIWSYAYYVISVTNNVLANIEGKSTDQKAVDNLKAECLFLRAFCHFDLVRTYAQPYSYTEDASHDGVPVIITVQTALDKPYRASVADVYKQIEEDLLAAENLISPDYARSAAKDSRAVVSIYAIQALLSRLYLYEGRWQDSADYATKVIDSKKFRMWTPKELTFVSDGNESQIAELYETFAYSKDSQSDGEVIFEVYSANGQSYGGGNEGICSMTSQNKYGDGGVSKDLMDLYSSDDVRGTLFQHALSDKDNRVVYWTAKYFGKGMSNPDYCNAVILRLSEMYLNRAEALYHGAKITGASVASDLKTIEENRNADVITNPSLNDIYTERTKELAWEGHEWFDLGRTKRDMTRNDFEGAADAKTCKAGSYKWAMPIPRSEHIVNENLSHNPGY